MIHTDDHPPAHAHCYHAGGLVIVSLSDFSVRDREHVSDRDARIAVRIVRQHEQRLWQAWREIHGTE